MTYEILTIKASQDIALLKLKLFLPNHLQTWLDISTRNKTFQPDLNKICIKQKNFDCKNNKIYNVRLMNSEWTYLHNGHFIIDIDI